jgi:signal transduction histidine kinase
MMGAPRGVGASRVRGYGSEPDLVAERARRREPAAAALDFAVAQILRDDPGLGTLPAVLARLVNLAGVRAALAFRPSASQTATVLAMYPPDAVDPALIAKLSAATLTQRHAIAGGPPVQARLPGDLGSALLAYSAPVGGQCLCAVALIGDPESWDEETRAATHAVAAIVATQIRHADDIARLAERQAELAEQAERLSKLDEDRNQFLAIVSHELRTPLTSIISFTELIRGEAGELTPEGVRFLDIIERNADRLHRLIGDLLMLERLEAGALPLDLAEVSVPDLAAEAVRSASAGAAKQEVALEVVAEPGPVVRGDQRRLLQVLDNLIANAVKFTHRKGRVRVSATWQDRQWRIDVADSGIGIPPDEVDQLFSRFVRASNARKAGLPGTGLGLSVVKVLVEMHGGRVEVSSTLGQGSTFSIYLPTAGGHGPAAAGGQASRVVPPGKTAGRS